MSPPKTPPTFHVIQWKARSGLGNKANIDYGPIKVAKDVTQWLLYCSPLSHLQVLHVLDRGTPTPILFLPTSSFIIAWVRVH